MSVNIVYDTLLGLMPGNRKRTASGWTGMNGVCCIHNGETPDTRKRLSIAMGDDGVSCIVSCFNCKFRTIWVPGQKLGRKMRNFLNWMGMPDEQVKKLDFKIWAERERMKQGGVVMPREIKQLNFQPGSLPKGARPIMELLEEGCTDPQFLNTMVYLAGRGDDLLTGYDYYWTPDKAHDLHRRIIIPFRWKGEIVGWTARAIFPTKNRYHSEQPQHYLFNTEVTEGDWQYLFLCEGPFDAIAINGVATLGDRLSDDQIQWLNFTGKKIIVVPDMVNQGGTLVDVAAREGWQVSFPKWDPGIKDAADAAKAYGKLYTVWSIIDARVANKLEINVRRQRLR